MPKPNEHEEADILGNVGEPESTKAPNDWPAALRKALDDIPFDYWLLLRSGVEILFDGAELSNEGWVTLIKPTNRDGSQYQGFSFERGLEIRVSEIIAVAEAPAGT